MQGLSDLVAQGKATVGDIVKLPQGTIVAKRGQTIEIIPLILHESWALEEKVSNKFEYRKREVRDVSNDDLPWEFENGGTQWRRSKVQEYFVLLLQDILDDEKERAKISKGQFADPDKALLPCVLTFQRTNFNAGRELSTFFAKARSYRTPLFFKKFKLSTEAATNAKGTFSTYSVVQGENTPEKYYEVCTNWQSMVKKGHAKAAEMEDSGEASPAKHVDSKEDRF